MVRENLPRAFYSPAPASMNALGMGNDGQGCRGAFDLIDALTRHYSLQSSPAPAPPGHHDDGYLHGDGVGPAQPAAVQLLFVVQPAIDIWNCRVGLDRLGQPPVLQVERPLQDDVALRLHA